MKVDVANNIVYIGALIAGITFKAGRKTIAFLDVESPLVGEYGHKIPAEDIGVDSVIMSSFYDDWMNCEITGLGVEVKLLDFNVYMPIFLHENKAIIGTSMPVVVSKSYIDLIMSEMFVSNIFLLFPKLIVIETETVSPNKTLRLDMPVFTIGNGLFYGLSVRHFAGEVKNRRVVKVRSTGPYVNMEVVETGIEIENLEIRDRKFAIYYEVRNASARQLDS